MADVVANGVRHHVQRFGKGERTVVFIHGLVMDNLSSFYFTLANPIAETCDVICYDLRGHGMSERPPTGYTVDSAGPRPVPDRSRRTRPRCALTEQGSSRLAPMISGRCPMDSTVSPETILMNAPGAGTRSSSRMGASGGTSRP